MLEIDYAQVKPKVVNQPTWPRRLLLIWAACVALRTHGGWVLTYTEFAYTPWWSAYRINRDLMAISGILACVLLLSLLLRWRSPPTRWLVSVLAMLTAGALLDDLMWWRAVTELRPPLTPVFSLAAWTSFAPMVDFPLTWWCAPACAVGAMLGGRRGGWTALATVTTVWAAMQLPWTAHFAMHPGSTEFWRWDSFGVTRLIRASAPILIVLMVCQRRWLVLMAVIAMTVSILLTHWRRIDLTGILYFDVARNDLPLLGYLTFPLAWLFAIRHLSSKLNAPVETTPEEQPA